MSLIFPEIQTSKTKNVKRIWKQSKFWNLKVYSRRSQMLFNALNYV